MGAVHNARGGVSSATPEAPLAGPLGSAAGFRCLLDAQPAFLVPERLVPPVPRDATSLVINPDCRFSWAGGAPSDVANALRLLENSAEPDADAVWVRDERTGAILPFGVGAGLRAVLEGAAPGRPLPAPLAPPVARVLHAAGILISPAGREREKADWVTAMASARAHFERGYVPLAGLIHPFHLGEMRHYFRRRIRTGAFPLGDDQSALRHFAHNEPVARFFHYQLAGAMSQVAGEPVKPSYVYFASYQGGAELEKHTDREQCEFSITFCVDYTPEPEAQTGWPILLETPQGTVTVYQAIGDALLYRGCRVPHYRKRLWRGATSSSIFFHYVRESFKGPLN